MEQYDFFIVRVWRRDGENGEQWTGRLEHLQGRDGWRFGDADALLAYLRDLIGPRQELAGHPTPTPMLTRGQDAPPA